MSLVSAFLASAAYTDVSIRHVAYAAIGSAVLSHTEEGFVQATGAGAVLQPCCVTTTAAELQSCTPSAAECKVNIVTGLVRCRGASSPEMHPYWVHLRPSDTTALGEIWWLPLLEGEQKVTRVEGTLYILDSEPMAMKTWKHSLTNTVVDAPDSKLDVAAFMASSGYSETFQLYAVIICRPDFEVKVSLNGLATVKRPGGFYLAALAESYEEAEKVGLDNADEEQPVLVVQVKCRGLTQLKRLPHWVDIIGTTDVTGELWWLPVSKRSPDNVTAVIGTTQYHLRTTPLSNWPHCIGEWDPEMAS